jgi:hypothetical protein
MSCGELAFFKGKKEIQEQNKLQIFKVSFFAKILNVR